MDTTSNSILTDTKKLLGLAEDYEIFDQDIVIYINAAFSTLFQLGIGPTDKPFTIADKVSKWSDFSEDPNVFASVKVYIYQKVRLAFDPPQSSFAVEAIKEQITEWEWRLHFQRELIADTTEVSSISSDSSEG